MKLRGLALQIRNYLKANDDWHAKNRLTELVWKYPDGKRTYGAAYVDRALRHLQTLRVLAVKYEGGHGFYRYLAPEQREAYIPSSERPDDDKNKVWATAQAPRRITGYETVIRDGTPYARPVYGL